MYTCMCTVDVVYLAEDRDHEPRKRCQHRSHLLERPIDGAHVGKCPFGAKTLHTHHTLLLTLKCASVQVCKCVYIWCH